MITLLIIIASIIAVYIVILSLKIYTIKVDTINLINGGVKSGKSTLAIYLAIKHHKAIIAKIKLHNKIRKIFKKELIKEPLLYSNIPIKYKYYEPLTTSILERETIPIDRSIIYIGEFSLVADSMCFKDMLLNEKVSLFFKLAGHSFNGKIFIDTQNINDCHYGLKKCITRYIYIHHTKKTIPLLLNLKICEMAYSYGSESVVNQFNGQIEDKTMNLWIPKSIWKAFDYRCYKSLDKGKKIATKTITKIPEDLQANDIPTFMDFKTITLNKGVKKNETRNETQVLN